MDNTLLQEPNALTTWNPLRDDASYHDERMQPWRQVWPPSTIENPDIWKTSEAPNIHSWAFDPKHPEDRPWREWARSSTTQSKIGGEEGTASIGEKADDSIVRSDIENGIRSCEAPETMLLLGKLDPQVAELCSTSAVPQTLNYLAPLKKYSLEKPYVSRLPPLPGFPQSNIVGQDHLVAIHEISGQEQLFNLDISGFQFVKYSNQFSDWTEKGVREAYFPHLSDWLKEHFDCSEVYLYTFSFRGKSPGNAEGKPWKRPFLRVHCDATPHSCSKRLQMHVKKQPDELANKRIRFLNIWRAITTPMQTSPMAFCDARTVLASDLVATDIVYPHYVDEAYEVLYSPSHQWFYKQGMQEDDMVLFKLADSASGVAQLCPHSAFLDLSVPNDVPERASMEIRAIIIG